MFFSIRETILLYSAGQASCQLYHNDFKLVSGFNKFEDTPSLPQQVIAMTLTGAKLQVSPRIIKLKYKQ